MIFIWKGHIARIQVEISFLKNNHLNRSENIFKIHVTFENEIYLSTILTIQGHLITHLNHSRAVNQPCTYHA